MPELIRENAGENASLKNFTVVGKMQSIGIKD